MAARNGPETFGWVTRALHWTMAAALLGMLVFGTVLARMQPSLATIWLFALHKSIGLTLLCAVILRLAWHAFSPPPDPLREGVPAWQVGLARAVRTLFYALMLAVPLSGWIASAATGIDVVVWGVPLPRIAPVSEAWETAFFTAHWALTRVLIAAIAVHAAGALLHHAVYHDRTLARMISG